MCWLFWILSEALLGTPGPDLSQWTRWPKRTLMEFKYLWPLADIISVKQQVISLAGNCHTMWLASCSKDKLSRGEKGILRISPLALTSNGSWRVAGRDCQPSLHLCWDEISAGLPLELLPNPHANWGGCGKGGGERDRSNKAWTLQKTYEVLLCMC